MAAGLELAPKYNFFIDQANAYKERRDILMSYFDQLGLSYTVPDGSYFLLVDISKVKIPKGFEVPETVSGRGKDFECVTCRAGMMADYQVLLVLGSDAQGRWYSTFRGKLSLLRHRLTSVLLQRACRHWRKVCSFRLRTSLVFTFSR